MKAAQSEATRNFGIKIIEKRRDVKHSHKEKNLLSDRVQQAMKIRLLNLLCFL